MNKIIVNKSDLIDSPMFHHNAGLSYTSTGYGSKIPNRYKVKLNNRLYRLYTAIFSNIGTSYIICKGERIIVDVA